MQIKNQAELALMAEGGKRLGEIKAELASMAQPGISTGELDSAADKLIKKSGGEAAFKKVPGYHHATCISVNDEVVHGVPGGYVLKEGDVASIDVGLVYKEWYTDTSTTVIVKGPKYVVKTGVVKFLEIGRLALNRAIAEARPGKRVMDLSRAMQTTVEGAGYSVVRALTGHGVGRALHEEPAVPCFVLGKYENSPKLVPGMVVAIEIMYNAGKAEVVYKNDDGWTIATADGKISGLFEETVAVSDTGPVVLTQA